MKLEAQNDFFRREKPDRKWASLFLDREWSCEITGETWEKSGNLIEEKLSQFVQIFDYSVGEA